MFAGSGNRGDIPPLACRQGLVSVGLVPLMGGENPNFRFFNPSLGGTCWRVDFEVLVLQL